MKLNIIILSMFAIFMSGCNAARVYVVKRPVKLNPVFVVIPSSHYLVEVEFANELEKILIHYKQKISSRPAKVFVEVTIDDAKYAAISQSKLVGAAGGTFESGIKSERQLLEITKESFYVLDDVNADYIIITYKKKRVAKVYRKKRKELVGLYHVDTFDGKRNISNFGFFLKAIGIPGIKVKANNKIKASNVYIVRDDISLQPAFAIMPANSNISEIIFSNYVERRFFEYGVSIVRPPSLKKIEKTEIRGEEESKVSQSKRKAAGKIGVEEKVKEYYFEFEESIADYYVGTYNKSKQVRIIRRGDNSVVSIFNLTRLRGGSDGDLTIIKENLEKLGIIGSRVPVEGRSEKK